MKTCTIILFIQSIGIVLASSSSEESALSNDSKIIGGNDAPHIPYMVSLKKPTGQHLCGGSIINARWIVTAAHCLVDIIIPYVEVGSNFLSRGGRQYRIFAQVSHPQFDRQSLNNDVGMLKTVNNMIFSGFVRAINLPLSALPDSSAVTIYGWGSTSSAGQVVPDILQQLQTTSISIPRCRSMNPNIRLSDSQICSRTRNRGICFGDSGGPVVFQNRLHGIVSIVVRPCGSMFPDVHVNVVNFKPWIERIMAN